MARVALLEVALDSVETPITRFTTGASVYVYKRGTETQADVYDDDSAGDKLAQPLTTDKSGRIRGNNGETAWIAEGSYDICIAGEVVPWEAAKGGGGGAVEGLSTNGKGYEKHGEDAERARPSGFASIEWHGSVEPENALDGDTWIEE